MKPTITEQVRLIRNATQHTYEQIERGVFSSNSPYVLAVDGIEEDVEDSTNPGQVLKTFDRLSIGPHTITFGTLKAMLDEMGDCAERITAYRPA